MIVQALFNEVRRGKIRWKSSHLLIVTGFMDSYAFWLEAQWTDHLTTYTLLTKTKPICETMNAIP